MENTNSCEETNHENGIWSWNIVFQVWNGKYKQWIVTKAVRNILFQVWNGKYKQWIVTKEVWEGI